MFGYIKPDKNNLLVKDAALYKATYCGLCSVIKKEISFFLPFALSYDFVFLSMVRSALTGEKGNVNKGQCKYNPFKKCAFCVCEKETLFTAHAALILTSLKLEDDIKDKDIPLHKSILLKPFYAHLSRRLKKLLSKEHEYKALTDSIRIKLDELTELERANSNCIDRECEIFGEIMADITSFSLNGSARSIASEIGLAIGRYIYLIDAIDDVKKDEKSSSYNPLLTLYGSTSYVKEHYNDLDITLSMYAKQAALAANLLEECDYSRIIENTITLGLGAVSYKIMTENGDKND